MHSCAPWLEPWAPWYMFSMHPSAHKKTLVRPLVYYVHPVLCYFGVVYTNIACHHHDVTWNIDHKEWRQVWNLKKHNHIRDPDNISIEMIKWLNQFTNLIRFGRSDVKWYGHIYIFLQITIHEQFSCDYAANLIVKKSRKMWLIWSKLKLLSLRRPQNPIVDISTYIEIAKVDEIMTIVQPL